MKISIRHNNTEIVIDDNDNGTTIKYSNLELIRMLEKMSLEIQAIETNYAKSLEEPQATPTHVGGLNIAKGLYPQICVDFIPDGFNTTNQKCVNCGFMKIHHPSKTIIAGV
jgi:hypothetical protein